MMLLKRWLLVLTNIMIHKRNGKNKRHIIYKMGRQLKGQCFIFLGLASSLSLIFLLFSGDEGKNCSVQDLG